MRKRMVYIIIWFVLLQTCATSLYAQYTDHRNRQVDSLEQVLATNPPTGVELARIYRDLMWGYQQTDVKKSMDYARKCVEAFMPLNSWNAVSDGYMALGVGYYKNSQYDSVMTYYGKAIRATELMRDFPEKYTETDIDDNFSSIYGQMGNLYNIQGQYHEAIDYYTKALRLFEKHDWKESQAIAYGNIGEMYKSMDNYGRAEINLLKADSLAYLTGDSLMIAASKWGLGNLYVSIKEYGKALKNAEIASGYYFSHPEEGGSKAETLNLLAGIYLDGYDNDGQAEEYVRQALALANEFGIPREKSLSLCILSSIYLKRGEWRKAEQTALEALATDDAAPANTLSLYTVLAKAYAYQGDAVKSAEYFDKHNELQSSWSNKHYQSAIREMEVKYETEKKDIRIEALAKERRLYLFLTITGCGGVLLVLSLLFYRNRLHRRQKQLLVTQVALESETAERSRLARDLHDGLGGMLSLVQVNLKDVKGMKVLEPEDAEHFGTALDMLQSSIVELRRVAHHMMPEALIKYGLKTSLQDFILAVPGADFHFFGEEKRLDSNLEAVVYRSAHELINNVLKHASATHLDVQLVQETDRVALTVTDNGKGFDTAQETKGMGLQNIRNRILVYGGQMHIFSDGKSGTEVNIEIPLKG